jgi:aldehyde:ferredoxin oxidoreductase
MIMTTSGGTLGQYLTVDLTEGTIETHKIPDDLQKAYIGGYGLGARMLYDMVPPNADPLGPENVLGFVTGPLTGTAAFLSSRYVVVGKSPLTGGWGDANSGGSFGPQLKFAGFDAVFVRGTASEPVYLWIEDGQAELRPAGDLWGQDAVETELALQERHGKGTQVACIGPAGERISLISCVINEKGRAAGRSGLGAVMGVKKLKAIAVRGSGKPVIADPEALNALRKKYLPNFRERTEAQNLNKYGTTGSINALVSIGRSPIRNWAGTAEEYPGPESFHGDNMLTYQSKKYGCWHCNQACGGYLRWEWDGEEHEDHKPEYETMALAGSNLELTDIREVMMLNEMCNRAGLDTISAGAVLGFAMEAYQNGLITASDIDGQELKFGNGRAAIALLQKIIDREGIGDLLADGTMRAAQELGRGSEAYAIHSGGQELPAHDPRQASDFGLAYQISPTPGRHTQGGVGAVDMGDEELDLIGLDKKLKEEQPTYFHARAYAAAMALKNVVNAVGQCTFLYWGGIPSQTVVLDFLNAVTGWGLSMQECLEAGERIEDMRLLFGLREGYNPVKNKVVDRAMGHPPLKSGPTAGVSLDLSDLRSEYLKVMDWDPETGLPSQERLESLGMANIVK